MWQIFLGSLLLSLIHALIPHHWIPLIAISKSEKWTTKETLFATFVTGFSHMISTIIIGIIVGFVGIKLSESYSSITTFAAPTILLLMGIIFVLLDFRSTHNHRHFDINSDLNKSKKSKTAIITSLSLAMFFAPCIEIEVFYFQAANFGWAGIFVVSAVYLVMTLLFLFILVYLGLKGVNKFNLHFLENHSKSFTGIILILLGLVAYFIEF
ncbi:MAG: hypothetical protein GZ091_07935 [Paludibacter sp.]|nr:hypothetical protein [Paludibacter sp.]